MLTRRDFVKKSVCAISAPALWPVMAKEYVQTVLGKVEIGELGRCLVHEHFLVDFIGAALTGYHRWNRDAVVQKVLPYLNEIKRLGVQTIFECTPAYLGRDPELLKILSNSTGLHIVTNTGFYGAVDNKYLPAFVYDLNAERIADIWIREFEKGIEKSGVKPGFIKTSVNPGPLSLLHQKLIKAAALTHRATGLSICSHTGPAFPAFEEMDILEKQGVKLDAFVWVHAQNESDDTKLIEGARRGAMISLDGVHENSIESYASRIELFRNKGLLHKLLIAHDAGWYKPDEENGGEFRPFTDIFNFLIPELKSRSFEEKEIAQLLDKNPAETFKLREDN
ncbi:MAG: phosphotriesterase [Cyclobacteriaceae bacterium]